MIRFVWPFVWLLLPLPLLAWWLLPPWQASHPAVRIPFYRALASRIDTTALPGGIRRNWPAMVSAVLVWAALVAGLARPELVLPPASKELPTRDLMLALDLSRSMDARDFLDADGNHIDRFTAILGIVEQFVARRKGDRIGLIVFGDRAYVQTPLTLDHSALAESLHALRTGMAGDATAIGDAVLLAVKLLEGQAEGEKTLIVLSDGDDTASRAPPQNAAKLARARGVRVHAVGVSAPPAEGEAQPELNTLQEMAALGGGQFFRGADRQQIEQVYQTLDRLEPARVKVVSVARQQAVSWVCAAASLVMLLLWQGAALMASRARRRCDADTGVGGLP